MKEKVYPLTLVAILRTITTYIQSLHEIKAIAVEHLTSSVAQMAQIPKMTQMDCGSFEWINVCLVENIFNPSFLCKRFSSLGAHDQLEIENVS